MRHRHSDHRPGGYGISIHAPREGCDPPSYWSCPPIMRDFNPRTPRGVRPAHHQKHRNDDDFNPRTPRGVRPQAVVARSYRTPYFNPRTPRGVRPRIFMPASIILGISIHAPREGCDCLRRRRSNSPRLISIHAPREGCDPAQCDWPLHGSISIHAPREGCDRKPSSRMQFGAEFQSTHPARGATAFAFSAGQVRRISIHAPREGCDTLAPRASQSGRISIHAPREGCDAAPVSTRTAP